MSNALDLAIRVFGKDDGAKATLQGVAAAAQSVGTATQAAADKATQASGRMRDANGKFVKSNQDAAQSTKAVDDALSKMGGNDALTRAESKAKSFWEAMDIAAERSENLNRSLDKLKMAGAGMALAGAGGIMLSNELVQAYREGEGAAAKLEAMLQKRGEGGRFEEMTEWASKLAHDAALVDDDPINDAAAGLAGFGLKADQVKQIMPGLIGQSRLYHQSLDQVSMSLGKAFAKGDVGALVKAGVTIDPATVERIKNISDYGERQKAVFEAVKKSMDEYALSMTEGLSESEIQANRTALALDNVKTALGKGSAEAQESLDGMFASLLNIISANPGLAETAGWLLTMGSHGLAAAGGILALAAQVAQCYLGMVQLAAARTAAATAAEANAAASALEGEAVAASGVAAGGAALGFGGLLVIIGQLALVALAAAAAIYLVDKALHWQEDRELASNIAAGDATDDKRLEISNKFRAKRGEAAETMEQFKAREANPDDISATDPASQISKIQEMMDKAQSQPNPAASMPSGVKPSSALSAATLAGAATANASESSSDIEDLEDQLAHASSKGEKADLHERLRLAKRADKHEKAGERAATHAQKEREKYEKKLQHEHDKALKTEAKLADKRAEANAEVQAAEIEEFYNTRIAELEAHAAKGDDARTHFAKSMLEAEKTERMAAVRNNEETETGSEKKLQLAQIHAAGIRERARFDYEKDLREQQEKASKKDKIGNAFGWIDRGASIFELDKDGNPRNPGLGASTSSPSGGSSRSMEVQARTTVVQDATGNYLLRILVPDVRLPNDWKGGLKR